MVKLIAFLGDQMRRLYLALVISAALCGGANAGVYGDDLAKCLLGQTPRQDRTNFMVYTFVAMAQHPAVQPYAAVTPEQLDELQSKAAHILERSLTETCRTETIDALKFEGTDALSDAFLVFGQAAGRELMTDPTVMNGLNGVGEKFDASKFEGLAADAGLKP